MTESVSTNIAYNNNIWNVANIQKQFVIYLIPLQWVFAEVSGIEPLNTFATELRVWGIWCV